MRCALSRRQWCTICSLSEWPGQPIIKHIIAFRPHSCVSSSLTTIIIGRSGRLANSTYCGQKQRQVFSWSSVKKWQFLGAAFQNTNWSCDEWHCTNVDKVYYHNMIWSSCYDIIIWYDHNLLVFGDFQASAVIFLWLFYNWFSWLG